MGALNELCIKGLEFWSDQPDELTTDGLVDAIMSAGRQQASMTYVSHLLATEQGKVDLWLKKAKEELAKRLLMETK